MHEYVIGGKGDIILAKHEILQHAIAEVFANGGAPKESDGWQEIIIFESWDSGEPSVLETIGIEDFDSQMGERLFPISVWKYEVENEDTRAGLKLWRQNKAEELMGNLSDFAPEDHLVRRTITIAVAGPSESLGIDLGEDEGVPGVYTIEVDAALSDMAACDAALDLFHSQVPIDTLDHFNILVFDMQKKAILHGSNDHVPLSLMHFTYGQVPAPGTPIGPRP